MESNNNHGTRAALGNASSQSSSLTHRKTLLFVLKCDKHIEHITSKKARPRDWYVREPLLQDMSAHTDTMYDDGMECPPEFNMERHMEPIGELYQLHNDWTMVDRKFKSWVKARKKILPEALGGPKVNPLYCCDINDDLFLPPGESIQSQPEPQPEAQPEPRPEPEPEAEKAAPPPPPNSRPSTPETIPMALPEDRQEQFSAMVLARNNKRKKQSNPYGSDTYGPRKRGFTHVTMSDYIHTPLDYIQKQSLHNAYQLVTRRDGYSQPEEVLSTKIAAVFNEWHLHAMQRGTMGGLGGRMPPTRVTEFLRSESRTLVSRALVMQPLTIIPTRAHIESLGRNQARKACKSLGPGQGGNAEELQKRLKKHYKL